LAHFHIELSLILFHIIIFGTKGEVPYILNVVYHFEIIINTGKLIHPIGAWDCDGTTILLSGIYIFSWMIFSKWCGAGTIAA